MKKSKVLLSILLGLLFSSFTHNKVETYTLTITVNDLRNQKGQVQFALYNKDGSIPDEKYKNVYRMKMGEIINKSSTVSFEELPLGNYAVNILHDENKDGKIDKGWILPIEGIGFSNIETISPFNKPNFNKASFELNEDKKMTINILYL
ncbi:MAG: DUF2141 domain-containing protein [Bacteroidetes bacterium]|nr:MAG: DUF2141 domain-containing protein [Bacteroidota bacterium]MBL1145048.1 DUF2141 domain-containing protein [Bacteroidota bacterium]NOG57845.1 DUF2141 domain-containing protein [Bacteroidota bacterium]